MNIVLIAFTYMALLITVHFSWWEGHQKNPPGPVNYTYHLPTSTSTAKSVQNAKNELISWN